MNRRSRHKASAVSIKIIVIYGEISLMEIFNNNNNNNNNSNETTTETTKE